MKYVKSCLIITMLLGIGYSHHCDNAGSGDVNGDGNANVLDIVQISDAILGGQFADECAAEGADVNGDGEADVIDIVMIIDGVLG